MSQGTKWQPFWISKAEKDMTGLLTQVLRDELLTAVHDEDPPDIQLDVVLLLLVLKEVEGCATGDKEESTELQLALH